MSHPELQNTLTPLLDQLTCQISDLNHFSSESNDVESRNEFLHRQSIIQSAQAIIRAAQTPQDLYAQFAINKCEIAVMRLYLKWEAFQAIPLDGSISFSDLAGKLDADVNLVARLSRMLIATGMLALGATSNDGGEASGSVQHTHRSRFIASDPLFRSACKLILFEEFPQPAGSPDFFAIYGRHEPGSRPPRNDGSIITPYGFTRSPAQPDKPIFDIIPSLPNGPELVKIFGEAMVRTQGFSLTYSASSSSVEGGGGCAGLYGNTAWFRDLCLVLSSTAADHDHDDRDEEGKAKVQMERVQLVDVAGGLGSTLRDILASSSSSSSPSSHVLITKLDPTRCVLQDRPEVVARVVSNTATTTTSSEFRIMPVDIHTGPQPVSNAHVYLLRRVLHDYGDEACVGILRIIRDAMARGSKVVIMEMVVPDDDDDDGTGNPFCCAMDMAMMGIGGKERTRRDWERLVTRVGGMRVERVETLGSAGLGVVVVGLLAL